MKKLVLAVVSAVFALSLSAAQAADAPKGAIKITNFGKKQAVMFDHAKHASAKCEDCHHKQGNDKGENKCGTCHGAEAKGKALSFKDASHAKDKGACYSCHFGDGAKKKLKCGDCHK